MKRREFIWLLGGAALAWPLGVRAQQSAIPVVGFLNAGSPEPYANQTAAFRQGLSETGYVEGRNVAIEYRWAEGGIDRLPTLAAELVRRQVAVIVTPGNAEAARAAKAATASIPIVFSTGADPVQAGLVASLNRPGGNVTGVTGMNGQLGPKRLGLLQDLLPGAGRFAVLVDPNSALRESLITDLRTAASSIGRQLDVLIASTDRDIDAAFATLVQERAEALLVSPGVGLLDRRGQILALAARHRVPVIYPTRVWTEAGGLMSYGSSFTDLFRQAGIYTGRVLKGEKPADLPILRSTKFEMVINLKTAKALGLEIPDKLLALADEVIE